MCTQGASECLSARRISPLQRSDSMGSKLTSLRPAAAARPSLHPLTAALRPLLGASLALAAIGAQAQVAAAAAAASAPPASTAATDAGTADRQGALGRVTVQGKAERQKAGLGSRGGVGLLGSQDASDIPFSTLNYTEQLMRDQQSRTLADVLQNDASVRVMTAAQGFGEDFQIRGFAVPSGDVGFNGLYGLSSGNRMPAEIMERVEVLKGPTSMVNGMPPSGSVGGSINVVPKRAGDQDLTRVTTSFASGEQLGVALDAGRRFGAAKEWGVRVNGSYRDGEASIDDGNARQRFAALALDYRGQQLRWTLDAFKQHENIVGFRSQPAFLANIGKLPPTPDPDRNIYGNAVLALDDEMYATRVEYDISDRFTVWGGVGRRDSWTMQDFPTASPRADANGNFRVFGAWYDAYFKTTSADVGARARFDTFGVGHTVSVGFSHLEQETGSFYLANDAVTAIPSSIYNPVPMPAVTKGPRLAPTKASDTTLSGVAIADTMSFMNERLLVTVGLRDQSAKVVTPTPANAAVPSPRYDKNKLGRLAGVVVKPTEDLSVYANFAEGLTRGVIVGSNSVNEGEVFPPQQSRQIEAGVKMDWGSFLTSASVYQIERPNQITTNVPPDAKKRTTRVSFDGEQRNRGIELSAQGEIIRSVRWLASASFTDAKQTRTTNGTNNGKDVAGVADRTLSVGADWSVPYLRGLAINGRVIHTSDGWMDNINTIRVPGWTRTDIGARYTTRIAGVPTVIRANVENLFDRHYWLLSGSYVTVATGRTVVVSASFDF